MSGRNPKNILIVVSKLHMLDRSVYITIVWSLFYSAGLGQIVLAKKLRFNTSPPTKQFLYPFWICFTREKTLAHKSGHWLIQFCWDIPWKLFLSSLPLLMLNCYISWSILGDEILVMFNLIAAKCTSFIPFSIT